MPLDQPLPSPGALDAHWMPYTANRAFKQDPRLLVAAEGMHYTAADGHRLLDATAGLWCCNAGHAQPKIVQAIQRAAATLDFAPAFQLGHPLQFELAERLVQYTDRRYAHVFFTNSGSEAVDTALKMALAYHRMRGDGARTRLIGRERGYHGCGFGGISVGGIVNNRKLFGPLLPGVDHLPHTHDLAHNAFSRGQPSWGAHLADELERLVALHDASTIAAVIVEPVAGSTGVLIPPVGYLERLREICTRHGILLIFDEVITGFGRLGARFAFERFGVEADLVTVAKGITSGTVPMGAVFAKSHVYDAFMHGRHAPKDGIELFHGYTYSGHPLACAAAQATLDVYEEQRLVENAANLADYWQDAVHALRDAPHVIDVRNLGLLAGIELQPRPDAPGARAATVFKRAFDTGLLLRYTGDTIAMSPPLILQRSHIDEMVERLAAILREVD
ncbi:MAG TPA: aspartate aminotransferase family protein [Burkholderiaceae bacterium]|nr:aspartate aminotransferase family protein [Burkholderiaceae bacterium]